MTHTGIPTKTTTSNTSQKSTQRSASQRGRGGRQRGGRPRKVFRHLTERQKMTILENRKLWEIPGTKEYAEMAYFRREWVKKNPHSMMKEFYTMYLENDY